MLHSDIWYSIRELGRNELIRLIDTNDWNLRLKTVSPEHSIIPIFHYWNNFYQEERRHVVAIDRFWRDQIMGILTYTADIKEHTAIIITVGTVKKWHGIGTLLVEKFLSSHQANIHMIMAEIAPEDPDYELRWKKFLKRKTREFGIQLQTE